jgi:hypothetical protein
VQRIGAGFRRAEPGHAGLVQDADRLVRLRRGEDRDRLAAVVDVEDVLVHLRRPQPRGGPEHGDHRVAMIRLHQFLQHRRVLPAPAAHRQVDQRRVADLDALRGEPRAHLRRRPDHRIPAQAEPIHHHRRAAAGAGQHRDAVALRRRPAEHQPRQLHQPLQRLDAQDAVLAEEGRGELVRPHHRPGMRDGDLPPHIRPPELVDDDRLAERMRAPRRRRQPRRIAQRLEEHQHAARRLVLDHHLGHLAGADVTLVADRDQLREGEAPRHGAREQRAHHRPALRHHGQPARRQRLGLHRRVVGDRHAVRHVH